MLLKPEERTGKQFTFILGPPCCGKSTLCKLIANETGAVHLSIGEILRKQNDPTIQTIISTGRYVQPEEKRRLLRDEILKHASSKLFLIDGYIESGLLEELNATLLVLTCNPDELQKRFGQRSQKNSREDDKSTSISERVKQYYDGHSAIFAFYRNQGKIHEIDASGTEEEVYAVVKHRISK